MERCQDSSCGFENRKEYCTQEAKDPDGDAAYVAQAIDELLYENESIASENYAIYVDRDGHVLQRSFSITHFDSQTYILPLIKSTIAIMHVTNRNLDCDSYGIELTWAVERIDTVSEPYTVQYTIDLYKKGLVQAIVEQPDILNNGRETSAITSYDFNDLYWVLDLFAASQRAERADNVRAQAV